MQSKYCYPNTDILINKFNCRDPSKLEMLEKELTFIRITELYKQPITDGKFDLNHLRKIHKYIFQDLYDFAGKIRDESIAKGTFQFASPLYIKDMANDLFRQLQKEKHLSGIGKEEISERLAYYLSEINVLHPFREGNGRTQREFIRTLAMKNGFILDWNKVNKEELLKASIKSVANYDHLQSLISECIENDEPSQEVMKKWKEYENVHERE